MKNSSKNLLCPICGFENVLGDNDYGWQWCAWCGVLITNVKPNAKIYVANAFSLNMIEKFAKVVKNVNVIVRWLKPSEVGYVIKMIGEYAEIGLVKSFIRHQSLIDLIDKKYGVKLPMGNDELSLFEGNELYVIQVSGRKEIGKELSLDELEKYDLNVYYIKVRREDE